MTLSQKILDYYLSMPKHLKLPKGVDIIYPYDNAETKRVMKLFFEKYYDDSSSRGFLLGINPGRFGSGITGIGFCDSVTLENYNYYDDKDTLSSLEAFINTSIIKLQ